MDLVEIRKKAKSRKPKKEGTEKGSGRAARKRTPKKEEPSVPARDTKPADSVDLSGETQAPEKNAPRGKTGKSAGEKTRMKVDTPANIEEVLLSQREEVKEDEVELLQLLTFQLGGEEYALNIMDIKEIIRPVEPTEVPKTPDLYSVFFPLGEPSYLFLTSA
jgi:purine-binding chemotaxis protein CheW